MGIVDVKSYFIESAEEIAARVRRCLDYAPADKLAFAPDCGLSQTARWAAKSKLANMVAGNAKKDFTGFNVSISLPSVIIGAKHKLSQSKVSPFLVIPCQSQFGNFNLEVAIKSNQPAAVAGGAR